MGGAAFLSKTATKLFREFYWKPRFRAAERLFAVTGIDLLTFRELKDLRDKHAGQRVIIMGNGPSLSQVDLAALSEWTTFASNKIYLIFDQTPWRPTYFSVEDDLVIIQNIDRLREKIDNKLQVVIPYICKVYRKNLYGDVFFGYSFRKLADRRQHFGTDPFKALYNGYSIVYTQIQLAMYMGAKEIALIGVDFSFKTDQEQNRNGELIGSGAINHFVKEYRKKGERWNPPLLDKQEISFNLARNHAEAAGVKIYNCTPGSKLNVFPTLSLEEFLSRGQHV